MFNKRKPIININIVIKNTRSMQLRISLYVYYVRPISALP